MSGREFYCGLVLGPEGLSAPQESVSGMAIMGAVGLLAWAGVAAVGLAQGIMDDDRLRLRAVALSGVLFQAGHFGEHVQQITQIAQAPDRIPMSPVGHQLVLGLSQVFGGTTVGNEALHFFGDLIYTSGLAACFVLATRFGIARGRAGAALAVQVTHQSEHLLLFGSTLLLGHPIGLTTMSGLVWVRVTIHFVLNLTGTALWVSAFRPCRRAVSEAKLCVA